MTDDAEGFWYPEINQAECIGCGLCQKACPVLNRTDRTVTPAAYASYCKDEKIRMESSSGGLFTAFAEEVIGRGGVVFGARFDGSFQAVHDFAETSRELEAFRGSKYVQSRTGDAYRQTKTLLEQGRLVYFSGTPCQIGGLKSFLGKEYQNLICQDLICHGVPSPKVWEKYVTYREALAGAPARKISFRQKSESWKRYSVSFDFLNAAEYRQTLDRDYFMRIYLRDLCLRPCCYQCAFKTTSRQSDITLADFWGIEAVDHTMFDDRGTSLVLTHTSKGRQLLAEISARAVVKEVDWRKISELNPAFCQSASVNPKRGAFFQNLDRWDFERLARKYGTDSSLAHVEKQAGKWVKTVLKALGLSDKARRLLQKLAFKK